MKPNIINVSLNNKSKNFSYPILIGNGLLSNCEEILKTFISKRKVILIHDNFFSLNNKNNKQFISFVEIIKKLAESINLIGIPGGDKTKNISQLEYILEKSLSFGKSISGHYIQGHVDTVGKIKTIKFFDKFFIIKFKKIIVIIDLLFPQKIILYLI